MSESNSEEFVIMESGKFTSNGITGQKAHEGSYAAIMEELRSSFKSGKTLPYSFRMQQLKSLMLMLETHETEIVKAVQKDLNRPICESRQYDLLVTKVEVLEAIRRLRQWMKPHYKQFNMLVPFDKAFTKREPFGVALIIGTWNYPIALSIIPLVGAISAGNCAVVKPSEIAPCTSTMISELFPRYLDSTCYRVVEGGAHETNILLQERFDCIFATCSSKIGRIIMSAAAKNLTPVILELGGKSPCFVDDSADMYLSAKRIIWGKFLNSGQTCVAPDYILCSKETEAKLLAVAPGIIKEMYGEGDLKFSISLSRIVNQRHFSRLKKLLDGTKGLISLGGDWDEKESWISPTFVVNVKEDDILMEDEIFGPILPFLTVESTEEAFQFIASKSAKPLSIYVFSNKKRTIDLFTNKSTSGSLCVNDTLMQIAMPGLPFGGVGESGMGNYLGKASFKCFSHNKAVVQRSFTWLAELLTAIRYPPYVHENFRVGLTYFLMKEFNKFDLPKLRISHAIMFLLGILLCYLTVVN